MAGPLNRTEIDRAHLDVDATLGSGQAFRWVRGADGHWRGAAGEFALCVAPADGGFLWQTYPERDRWDVVERYFALDVDLGALCRRWTEAVPAAAPVFARWAGLRVLRQEPVEALFAFLCATCNTMLKITRSVNALAALYGEPIAELDGMVVRRFPSLERLAAASEGALREALWGFRAPRVPAAARALLDRPDGWLQSLAAAPHEDARRELCALDGVGPKVADCICLFGLGHDGAVPVDTHIHRAAVRLFRPDLERRSVTPAVYEDLARAVRDAFGPYAGWAQQALFLDEVHRASGTEAG